MQFESKLKTLRQYRGFQVESYVRAKVEAINRFFREEGLDAAVMGISGGIDSAVTLALLKEAMAQKGSPLKKICPIFIPIYSRGTTNQARAQDQADQIVSDLGFTVPIVDLTEASEAIVQEMGNVSGPWAEGQLAPILRTATFYFQAAILQQQGYKSIVVGTTNRDEGSYIGFFGKGSDAMVDLQPIADIHKSEVIALAAYFELPTFLFVTPPRGDVWDGKNDYEMIGSPYEFLEYYLLCKQYNQPLDITQEPYLEWAANIEEIHRKNLHKYKVGLPSRFIDVMPRTGIIGGWN